MFTVVVVYFGVLVCCLCSMDEMLIRFSLVSDRWMTIPTPPLEPMNDSAATGCTTLLWYVLHCFGYMGLLAYRGRPYRQFGLGVLQGPCGHSGSPH
jgi:hypothetical protein